MNRRTFSMDRTLLILKHLAAFVVVLLAFSGTASALTVTATPPSINISQGMSNSIQIFYRAFELDSTPFTATSSQGRFETAGETLLGLVNSPRTISLVNNQGSTTESVIVPAEVITAALALNQSRILYRRLFTSVNGDSFCDVQLQIVPSSAGQFSLTQMTMEFNRPVTGNSTRPSSGGRITVPRNTRGLTATATLAYNGGGTLRGQWKVDGQILNHVTRYLTAGVREVTLSSPLTPGFPTYATGLHRVEFELLDPVPGFNEPIIFYYVSDEPPGPPLGSLKLITPLERDHIRLTPDALPEFSWQPARDGVVYHFQIYGLETPAAQQDVSRLDFSANKPLVAALTKKTSYTISIFDLNRIVPGIPYVWQVKAYNGRTGIAASLSRLVYFITPAGPPKAPVKNPGAAKELIPATPNGS